MLDAGKHVLSAGGSVGIFALVTRWLESRKAETEREARAESEKELAVTLANMSNKLDQLVSEVREHRAVFDDVVTTRNAVKALGEKFDEQKMALRTLETRLATIENRRRNR